MNEDYKKQVIQKIKILPTLPFVLDRIIQVMDDPKSSAADLKDTIIKDQSISAKILSLANSAFYGMPNKVTDLTRAIVVLGFNTVVDVAMSVSVTKIFGGDSSLEFDKKEFWTYSVSCAEAAKLVAEKINIRQAEYAYLLGLLHDLGKVILSNFFVEEYDEAVINAKLNNSSLTEEEINIFGFDHTEAARVLGLKWKLPDKILTPIVFHHDLNKIPVAFKKEIMMIHLSEYITKQAEIGNNGESIEFKLNFGLVSEFKIRDNEINEMIEKIINLKEKIYNFTEILL